ncbi:MAG TPA: hypothetical protein VMF52_16475 [Steroidobacteraceae bacterium]|nr:hypothetical protein [Steroidobacteraceae bacterium]
MANTSTRYESTVRSAADQQALEAAIAAGTVVVDTARRRPFYFDGRFLTAADLSADQDYARARQSDLAQAIGAGIVRGLRVTVKPGATAANPELEIEAGVGITPAGDLVSVENTRSIRVSQIGDEGNLDVQLGVKLLPTAATNNRSGLFVLALRPIEFSANPVPSYPTTLDGARSVHDGDIFEATAVTLIPYPDRAGVEGADAKRARVAREIFFDGTKAGVLQEALPLAMLCLEGGALRWLDTYLVRREIGAESTLGAGLNQRPRGLLESWLQQHLDHVATIPSSAISAGFPATSYFSALPPVGLLPAANVSVDAADAQGTFVQSFFPPLVDCEFAFVPADEIAVLVSESLALPPIDLAGDGEDLDHLSVLIVAGVDRLALEQLKRSLQSVTRLVRAAAPGMLAKRLPLESLLAIANPVRTTPVPPADTAVAAAWKDALKSAQDVAHKNNHGCFWYIRRRQLPYFSEISGATLRLAGDAAALDDELTKRLAADGTAALFKSVTSKMPRLAIADTVNVLAAPRLGLSTSLPAGVFQTSDLLRRSAFAAIAATTETEGGPTHAKVLDVARRFGDPELGAGFDDLALAAPDLKKTAAVDTIAKSGVAPELDAAARQLPETARADFATRLAGFALAGKIEDVRKLVSEVGDNT